MIRCPKCQAENEDSAKFCTKCGEELVTHEANAATTHTHDTAGAPAATTETNNKPEADNTQSDSAAEHAVSQAATENTAAAPAAPKPATPLPNFFAFIIAAMMKPVTAVKEELPKFSDFKNSAIMTAISAAISMVLGVLSAMVSAVIVKRCSFFGSSCKTSIEFDNLGDLEWLQLTLISFIVYIVAIALLAGVFFGMSRIFKQTQTSFSRMMTVVAVAIIPMSLASFVGTLVGFLNGTLALLVMAAGSMYGFYMFYEGINNEAKIEGDKKVYFNFLSVLALLVVLAILLIILSESSSGFGLGGGSFLDLIDLM